MENTRQHILSQIKLCFDPSLKLVDCDGIIGFGTHQLGTCPPKGITYPATVSYVHPVIFLFMLVFIQGDKTYGYPKKLAVAHTRAWDEANSRCNSWICRALVYVYVLTWMTL
ncbi:hypothetical protein O3P69_006118 [Scylla paramamosain]|uniref:Uncharacterized protein n=1 Tax=Scylla paramamosain TaxID=85552 RepID=A0AAW0U5Z0_SCYPA